MRQAYGFVTFDLSDVDHFVVVISHFVGWVEWVTMSLRFEVSVSDVSIINVAQRGGSHLCQVPRLRTLDVVEIHDVSCLVVSLFLWL